MSTQNAKRALTVDQRFMFTEGASESVWAHADPYEERPRFKKLTSDAEADVVIIGSGIAGISAAYELVRSKRSVMMLEAREVLSGESDRTSGHLSSALDDGYVAIRSKHGDKGAAIAYESHKYALERVGQIAKELDLSCEYRTLDAYEVSQYPRNDPNYEDDIKSLKEEVAYAKTLGIPTDFHDKLAVPGWTGSVDQRGGILWSHQATFNPTKYLLGVMAWLKDQPQFSCYTHTRVFDISEEGQSLLSLKEPHVKVKTEAGHAISANSAIMATCVPLQKLSVVAEMEYNRTYCIAIRIPKNSYTDCIVYNTEDPYKYVRFTACDANDDYLIVGGCDHKVGQAGDEQDRYKELEAWVRDRWTKTGTVDFSWSGQVFEPHDHVAFIGLNPGTKSSYVVTGDSGNGLTHGVMAGKILCDQINGKENSWSELYDPKRITSLLKSAKGILVDDLQVNSQYKRWLQTDVKDIEDIVPGQGAILNATGKSPEAIYKTPEGEVRRLSAICPHMKGILCYNGAEKSFDCPVHGSRFSTEGLCLIGPAKANLTPKDDASARALEKVVGAV